VRPKQAREGKAALQAYWRAGCLGSQNNGRDTVKKMAVAGHMVAWLGDRGLGLGGSAW
jgi:hypothetical protein